MPTDSGGHMRRHTSLVEQLAHVPLFTGLSEADLYALADRIARVKEPAGVVFTKEGEHGHEFLIVLEGEVAVTHGDHKVATLGPGDWFGELALLDENARRTATVVAQTRVEIGFLARHDFDQLLTDLPDIASRISITATARRRELDRQSS